MLLEAQDDVAGESCPSQFDSESSSSTAAMIASMRAEPCIPTMDKTVTTFRGSNSISDGARSWLQRSHIQRDEAAPPRRLSSDWQNRKGNARPSASAMVLARKRKRDEQRKLLNGKKQCTDSDGSECNAGDSEQDSLDMEEQLTAFVEYNATDMDSLDINPSQDFDGGDEEQEPATQASQYMQTRNWEDVTDVNQFPEEASEVFDSVSVLDFLRFLPTFVLIVMLGLYPADVIYAPRPASVPVVHSTPHTYHRPQENNECGIARPTFRPAPKAKSAEVGPPSDDSEDSLSDGFDVATNITRNAKPLVRPSTVNTNRIDSSSKPESKLPWRQRRSVKRDCSFIENSNNYSVNGRLLLMAPPAPATTSEAREGSSDEAIELKDGCFDSSEVQEVPMRENEVVCSVPSSIPATVDTMSVMCSSLPSSATYSGTSKGLQPRLVRKRRKVGQLTLDGFFRSKAS